MFVLELSCIQIYFSINSDKSYNIDIKIIMGFTLSFYLAEGGDWEKLPIATSLKKFRLENTKVSFYPGFWVL